MSGRDPARGRSRERGVAMGKAWQDRRPFRAPPPGTNGMPRRLVKRNKQSGADATAWARTQPWWPLVTNHHGEAYSDQRYYIFILSREP